MVDNSKNENTSSSSAASSDSWKDFDMEKFFKETDAVGKILEKKRKSNDE